jgi:hypothetical protein
VKKAGTAIQSAGALTVITLSSLVCSSRAQETNFLASPFPSQPQPGGFAETAVGEPAPIPVNPLVTTPASRYAASSESATAVLGVPPFAVPTASAEGQAATETALKLGPLTFRPHADYAFTYGTGINSSPGNQGPAALHSVSPGLLIQSTHLSLDYTPNLVYYTKGNFEDTVNHSANLLATFGYSDWQFQISQGYQKTSSPLIETGTQTPTESFPTLLSAHYRFSEKTSFDFNLTQLVENAEELSSYIQWSTMNWIDYLIGSRTSLGTGVGGGYVDVAQGSDMSYEQIQGRIAWYPSPKTRVDLNGGVEIRQFLDLADVSDLVTPLYGITISYRPFEYTVLSIQGNRSVSTSILQDQVTDSASIAGSLNQRLLGKLNLAVSGGFRKTDYISTRVTTAPSRTDDYPFVTVSLGAKVFKKGHLAVAYLHAVNDSTLSNFTYNSDQYTIQLGYHF